MDCLAWVSESFRSASDYISTLPASLISFVDAWTPSAMTLKSSSRDSECHLAAHSCDSPESHLTAFAEHCITQPGNSVTKDGVAAIARRREATLSKYQTTTRMLRRVIPPLADLRPNIYEAESMLLYIDSDVAKLNRQPGASHVGPEELHVIRSTKEKLHRVDVHISEANPKLAVAQSLLAEALAHRNTSTSAEDIPIPAEENAVTKMANSICANVGNSSMRLDLIYKSRDNWFRWIEARNRGTTVPSTVSTEPPNSVRSGLYPTSQNTTNWLWGLLAGWTSTISATAVRCKDRILGTWYGLIARYRPKSTIQGPEIVRLNPLSDCSNSGTSRFNSGAPNRPVTQSHPKSDADPPRKTAHLPKTEVHPKTDDSSAVTRMNRRIDEWCKQERMPSNVQVAMFKSFETRPEARIRLAEHLAASDAEAARLAESQAKAAEEKNRRLERQAVRCVCHLAAMEALQIGLSTAIDLPRIGC